MKTKIFTLLTALFALILCFSSCESTPPSTEQPQNTEATQAHTHTEVVDAAVAPTCTEAGKTEGKHCSVCNTVIVAQEEVAALGHTEVVDTAVAPTCTEAGNTEGKHCSVCNTVIVAQEEVAALGHTEAVDAAVAPTCTEAGKTEGKHCSVCNTVIVAQAEVAALGHTEVTDKGFPATESTTGLTDGKHCSVCNAVIIRQQVIDKILPTTTDVPYGKVTTEQAVIETNHLKLNMPKNVYLPENLISNIDLITSIMEEVSGMKFPSNKLNVQVIKPENGSELGSAYAFAGGMVLSSGDLVDTFALIHEASHCLQYAQSRWHYCTWAMEGISTYTTYKTQKYVAENHPELISVVSTVNQSVTNYLIESYEALYEHPLEYWIDNTFTHSGNQNYSIGFRFMWYLDEVYGNYTKWIYEYEKINPFYLANSITDQLGKEEQIKAFKLAYGDDVLDNFYAWLKNNETLFNDNYTVDLRDAESFRFYPVSAYGEIYYSLDAFNGTFLYNNLCIDIDAGRHYISDYKGYSTDGMEMTIDNGVTVELYDGNGTLVRTVTATYDKIPLDGVSMIKLVGEGEFHRIDITGFDSYHN